jgi:hypothetical protein
VDGTGSGSRPTVCFGISGTSCKMSRCACPSRRTVVTVLKTSPVRLGPNSSPETCTRGGSWEQNLLTAAKERSYSVLDGTSNKNMGAKIGNKKNVFRRSDCATSLSRRHGTSSGCGWRRRPPNTEGRCEYIE